MRLQQFLDVSQSADIATFERRLIDFAHLLDFGLVTAAMVLDRPGHDAAFVTLGNTPAEFAQSSKDAGASRRDPVLQRLKRLSVPFAYDQSLYVSANAADLWEEQATYGYRTGICVALHLPEHRHFLLGVDRERPLPTQDETLTHLLADLQLLAVHAQDAATRLLARPRAHAQAPRLTRREIEVLRWTMEGKSAWAVAEILHVSENTVNFHVGNILKKLDSASKHQAVLKALALGLL